MKNSGFYVITQPGPVASLSASSLTFYCVERFAEENIREVSDVHPVGSRSIRVVLGSRGCKNFFSRVNVIEFFNTIGRARTFGSPIQDV